MPMLLEFARLDILDIESNKRLAVTTPQAFAFALGQQ
jgi:hypothetical protein